jgi:hypothetical protein
MYGNTDEPAPAEEPVAPPTEPQTAEPVEVETPEQEASYKRQLEVLKGKYSAEVPRMAAEIRELKEMLAKAQVSAQPVTRPSKLSQEEIDEYGSGFIDVMKKAAAEVVPDDVGEIKQQVEQLRSESARAAEERFFRQLTEQAPQWKQLNENPEFLTWLSGIDPLSGRIRQEIFDEARDRRDGWRVGNFFNSFGGSQEPEQVASDPLADQVEPPTTRVSAPPPGKRTYTPADISAFYAAVREGKYTAADATRIEADIFAAQSEGRIRQRR